VADFVTAFISESEAVCGLGYDSLAIHSFTTFVSPVTDVSDLTFST